MIGIGITLRGVKEAERRYAQAVKETGTAIERAVSRSSLLLSRETRLQLSGRGSSDSFLGKRGAPAPLLGVRSGATRVRITPGGRVYRSGNTYFSAIGSADRYMKMHEEGGTITGNKFLRIPLAAAQTPAGVDREAGHSLRSVPGIFFIRSKGGNLFAVRKASRRSRMEFLYLLKPSVTIPARRPFATVRDRVAPQVSALTGGEVAVVMQRANNG